MEKQKSKIKRKKKGNFGLLTMCPEAIIQEGLVLGEIESHIKLLIPKQANENKIDYFLKSLRESLIERT